MRVLVVDDDKDHAESVADILLMVGHVIDIAYSGEEAIVRFSRAEFDAAVLDVKLPGIDGVETFFAFKKTNPDARVILMTGFSPERLIATALEGGVQSVLSKPFSVGDLLAAVRQLSATGAVQESAAPLVQ